MKSKGLRTDADIDGEISRLIESFVKTGLRLEELTEGQVDTVAGPDGQMFLLRHAQDQLRLIEASRQAAILNALPANIALLDNHGSIISVNEAWRVFADANTIQSPGHGVGVNYLEICDSAEGAYSAGAHQAAAGIRSILDGRANNFSMEYPCDAPTEQRWFHMMVNPVNADTSNGAVVMHMNITERKRLEQVLNENQAMLRLTGRIARLGGWSIALPEYQITWSDEVCTILEVPLGTVPDFEEALGFYTPQSRETIGKAIEVCVLDGTPFDIELELITTKAHLVWVRCIGKAERNANDVIIKLQGTFQDITERHHSEQQIVKTLDRLTGAQRIGKIGDWEWDMASETMTWSPQVYEITGRDPGLGPPRDYEEQLSYYDKASQVLQQEMVARTISSGKNQSSQLVVARPDGERLHVQAYAVPRKSETGKVLGLYGTVQDITESTKTNLRIRYLNRVYSMLSSINTLMVRERDVNELYRAACRIAVETGGFNMSLIYIVDPATQLINLVASAGKDDKLLAATKQLMLSADTASKTMIARAIREKKAVVSNDSQSDPRALLGTIYAEAEIRSQAILPLIIADDAIGVIVMYSSEVGAFHEEEVKLLKELAGDIAFASNNIDKQIQTDYLAYYDVLTGLANRTLFYERVGQYMRSATNSGHKLALITMNLERFKNLNDSLGRSAGDTLLKLVAEWLARKTGDANLLARIGADHYAMVIPHVKREGNLTRLLEMSMKAFSDHSFDLAGVDYRISARVGVAMFPDDGVNVETLYSNAETALKQSRIKGIRYLYYSHDMTRSVASELTLENQLRRALDNGEFVLHYQPKINLKTGKVTSAEALIRWNDPQTGLVPPGRFIPILEETGLIYEVGRWVVYKAVDDYLRWCNTGLAVIPIAVNVSSLQLRNPGFIADLGQAIGVDARAAAGLELEITESQIMEDVRRSFTSLQAIRDMGITIAIDDFGTGFSSLSYLAKLPVVTLKIDRSFIIEMTNSREGLALVSTIISLAHSLRLNVVAEGVETEEQSRLLLLLNCDEIQGYLFSKPLPCEEFEARYLTLPLARTD